MRLIDADLLLEHNGMSQDCRTCQHSTYRCGNDRKYTLMEFCERIDYEETVDAVPVVRCKDCKYKDKWEANAYGYQWCGVSGLQVVEDISFCSYGEMSDGTFQVYKR